MKNTSHPQLKEVMFKDMVTNELFLIKSTIITNETITKDGKTYPFFSVEFSDRSHPFYTKGEIESSTKGSRSDSFKKKYAK